jgi:hypothetical protein
LKKPIIIALLMFLSAGLFFGIGTGMNARPEQAGSGNTLQTIGMIITLAIPLTFLFLAKKTKSK